ncbi:MAG: BMP family lipoprotein [Romboutsia sp.]|uniref:BMP family lipoprotein n=1 Tax=Romboutsia sp. TaxID=1965302 RepID=UPI003F360909
MKLKKLLSLGLSVVMSASLLVGCSSSSESGEQESAGGEGEKVYKIGMVTDVGGVNDESFNQSAWTGLENIEKELGEDKVKVKYLESKQDADYVPNIEQFVDQEMDLVIGVGFKLADAIEEASTNYPEMQFALIDAAYPEQPANVTSLLFEDNVSAYLTGLVAGKMTKTDKVGFIGGIEGEVIDRFDYGFRAGFEAVKPEGEVMVQYANSFTDAALGKSIAQQMHQKGADIIFSAAGAVGIGAIEAAKENGKMAIGVDQDQNKLAPDNIITSAMKNIDVSVANLVRSMVEGKYEAGKVVVNTLEMGGVGIAPTSDKNVDAETLEFVNAEAEKIKSGDIKVPQNKTEYEELKK